MSEDIDAPSETDPSSAVMERTPLAKIALAAWVNVDPDQLPAEKMWIEHPNDMSRQAWDRVIEAILAAAKADAIMALPAPLAPDGASELELDLLAKAQVLETARQAIDGADIAHIRHSDGGIDLAKRVVNLQGAADWAVEDLRQAASRLRATQEALAALEIVAAASERSETMFGGKMSEVTRVFENITRVARQAAARLRGGR